MIAESVKARTTACGSWSSIQHHGLSALLDLLLEMAQNLAGLGRGPCGEEVFDLLQPLVVLDAEAANLPGVQLVERVDVERGPQDDLVEIAVREAMFVHVPQLAVCARGPGPGGPGSGG